MATVPIKYFVNPLASRTELVRRVKRYQIANHSCLLIKYDKDVRYDEDRVSTHDQ